MNEFHKRNVEWRKPEINDAEFHLYKLKKQVKVIYGVRNHENSYSPMCRVTDRRGIWDPSSVYFLIWVLALEFSSSCMFMIWACICLSHFNKNFNLETFPLWNMFLCGIDDSDRSGECRFDSNEFPGFTNALFPTQSSVSWQKGKFKKKKENLSRTEFSICFKCDTQWCQQVLIWIVRLRHLNFGKLK